MDMKYVDNSDKSKKTDKVMVKTTTQVVLSEFNLQFTILPNFSIVKRNILV